MLISPLTHCINFTCCGGGLFSIRGHVPGSQSCTDPGKEEASGIRGQIPGGRGQSCTGKEEFSFSYQKGIM